MEYLGYLLLSNVLLIVTKGAIAAGDATVSAMYGGAVEELLEAFIKAVFPNSRAAFFGKRMQQKKLWDRIREYCAELSWAEREELIDFLRRHADFLKANDCLEGETGAIRFNEKAFRKHVKSIRKEVEELQLRDLQSKSEEEIAKRMFPSAAVIPASVKKIARIVNEQVFEIKYVGLSADERDVVKVIQYMVNDGFGNLIGQMQKTFELIEQQNANPAFREAVMRLAQDDGAAYTPSERYGRAIEMVERCDPLFWVRLECPACQASGSLLRREGDQVHCSHCGNVYFAVKNADEDVLKEVQSIGRKLEVSLKTALKEEYKRQTQAQTVELKGDLEKVRGELDRIAEQIAFGSVGIQTALLDLMERMKEGRIGSVREYKRTDAIELAIDKAKEQILAEQKRENGALIAAVKSVSGKLYQMMSELSELVESNERAVRENGEAIRENGVSIQYCGEILLEMRQHIKLLSERRALPPPAPERVHIEAECPRCGERFSYDPSASIYQCPHCKLQLTGRTEAFDGKSLTRWCLTEENGCFILQSAQEGTDPTTAVLQITPHLVQEVRSMNKALHFDVRKVTRCVLIADHKCTVRKGFSDALFQRTNVQELILGKNVTASADLARAASNRVIPRGYHRKGGSSK